MPTLIKRSLNSFPNYKIKSICKDKLNVAKMTSSFFDRVETTVGKGEILVTSIFFFSHSFFQSFPFNSL